ncbi:PdmP3 (fragment) [Curtobacterium sp. 8I-2]
MAEPCALGTDGPVAAAADRGARLGRARAADHRGARVPDRRRRARRHGSGPGGAHARSVPWGHGRPRGRAAARRPGGVRPRPVPGLVPAHRVVVAGVDHAAADRRQCLLAARRPGHRARRVRPARHPARGLADRHATPPAGPLPLLTAPVATLGARTCSALRVG